MVKQALESKVSDYRFWTFIVPCCYLPASVQTTLDPEPSTGHSGYVISGSLIKEDGQFIVARESEWPEPPHIVFANLHSDNVHVVEAFTKQYGLLTELIRYDDPGAGFVGEEHLTFTKGKRPYFQFRSLQLVEPQNVLRRAWRGEPQYVHEIEFAVQHIDLQLDVENGTVKLQPKDLWTLICFLFLRDYTARRLGFCENPNCSDPYFRKKRSTQRFCEAGGCVRYAQQQWSLEWWKKIGKPKRDWRTFWRRHPDLKPSDKNKKLISDWVGHVSDTVDLESLERAAQDATLLASLTKVRVKTRIGKRRNR
jgi:hypothetical protein